MSHATRTDDCPAPAEYVLHAQDFDAPESHTLLDGLHHEQTRTYGFADAPTDRPADYVPPAGLFLIAYDLDGGPVACGGCRAVPGRPRTMEVRKMYVQPAHRGHGLGRRLLTRLEKHARNHGGTTMILETGAGNHAALGLYRAAGYIRIPSYVPGRDVSVNRAFAKEL